MSIDREVEFDPLTGIKTTLIYHDDGKVTVNREQDIEPSLEFANILRKKADPIENDKWNHYACVPVLGQLEMLKAGINMSREPKKAIEYINKHHPEWKVTTFWHDDRRAKIRDPRIVIK